MTTPLKIDFVSDIACPWCAIGLASLQRALARTAGDIDAELHFQPYELSPDTAPEGEDIDEHLAHKFGYNPEQLAKLHESMRQRGEAVGFAFEPTGRRRIVNTFNGHRLLYWAGLKGPAAQLALKEALMQAYHGRGERVDHDDVLLAAVRAAGLDEAEARTVLEGDAYTNEVRAAESRWQQAGIQSVPSVVINDRHLISGGQPPEVFEQALRQIAAGQV